MPGVRVTSGGGIINGIAEFSDDVDGLVSLWVDGQEIGEFPTDAPVDFVELLGSGIDSFVLTGIDNDLGLNVRFSMSQPGVDVMIEPLPLPIPTLEIDSSGVSISVETVAELEYQLQKWSQETESWQDLEEPRQGSGLLETWGAFARDSASALFRMDMD